MTDEQFKELNGKLDELNANLVRTHAEEFRWAQTISTQQQRFERRLGLDTQPRPFIPYYHPDRAPNNIYPEVYNKYGERMEFFFISDRQFAHAPNKAPSRYVIWDRFNYGNDTHFYTHDEILRPVGKPRRKFAMMVEPRSIEPQSYENVLKHKDYVEKNFELLFTYDAQLLNAISNSRLVPLYANVWYRKHSSGGSIAENYKHKTKNISMVSSAKEMCPMHILRKALAFKCKEQGLADTYGTFDGGAYVHAEKYLEQYRYSIAIENDISPFYFTEKIMTAFVAQTIPIYLGATKIDKFFNADGIIHLDLEDCKHIEKILKLCTPEEYERRLPAVLDNFNRAVKFTTQNRFDEMYINYIKKGYRL